MKLHQLSNGSWIDLSTVSSIIVLPTIEGYTNVLHRARVAVFHNDGNETLLANDDEDAIKLASIIANLVNEAHKQVSSANKSTEK